MSRLTLFVLCLVGISFVGCKSETPTSGDPEVPEAASKGGTSTPSADDYQVLLKTTKGDVLLEVHPEWSPLGAERFKELVELGFYDNCAFFRVIDGFMAQVGINGDPALHAKWRDNNIPDDPVVESNKRGYVSFANAGPDTRSTQFFINFGDNSNLDYGFSPFAKVIQGMDVIDSLYKGYGEGAPSGSGPSQGRIVGEGNAYLKKEFPMLDYIVKATIVGEEPVADDAKAEPTESAAKEGAKPAEPKEEPAAKKAETEDKPKADAETKE